MTYTEELVSLKEEISDLRNMASQIEIMQQSADFCMHGAYVTNQNIEHEEFFYDKNRASDPTRMLYE